MIYCRFRYPWTGKDGKTLVPRLGCRRGRAVLIKCREGSKGCSSPRDIEGVFRHLFNRLYSSIIYTVFLSWVPPFSRVYALLLTVYVSGGIVVPRLHKSNQRVACIRRRTITTGVLSMMPINFDIIHEAGGCQIPRCKPHSSLCDFSTFPCSQSEMETLRFD